MQNPVEKAGFLLFWEILSGQATEAQIERLVAPFHFLQLPHFLVSLSSGRLAFPTRFRGLGRRGFACGPRHRLRTLQAPAPPKIGGECGYANQSPETSDDLGAREAPSLNINDQIDHERTLTPNMLMRSA
jgi:hypothetical protein